MLRVSLWGMPPVKGRNQKAPEECADVFDQEKNVQLYVNPNDFNKTFEVAFALPEEPEERLKEKAEEACSIAEEVIKEHIETRKNQGIVAIKAELPDSTLDDRNGLINTVWDEASQEIEAEGLS